MAHTVTTTAPGFPATRSKQADRHPAVGAQPAAGEHALAARLPLIGLLAVQIFIGYEWFISGIVKVVRGGFPAGLAEELTTKSAGAPGWYASFLDDVAIPNARAFGYLTMTGEILMGVALIGGGLIWLLAWHRIPAGAQAATLAVIAFAALSGVFLNVNLHLANGSPHPWILPAEGFDEGVDLDSLMPAIQLAIAGVAGGMLLGIWRARSSGGPESHEERPR